MPLTIIRADHNIHVWSGGKRPPCQPDEMRSEMLPPKDRQTVTERQQTEVTRNYFAGTDTAQLISL